MRADAVVSVVCDQKQRPAYNPEHHQKMKHVERRHYFVREVVESNRLVVPFVRTSDNLADFFTKPLIPKVFFALRNQIMNIPDPFSSNGGALSDDESSPSNVSGCPGHSRARPTLA